MNEQTLGSKVTGNDYLSAYRSRMTVVNDHLLSVAADLTKQGCKVYHSRSGKVKFLVIRKDDKQITFGFAETPYRWYLSYSIDQSLKQGSSRTLKENYDFNTPYTVDQILSSLQPAVKEIVKPEQYLKLYEDEK